MNEKLVRLTEQYEAMVKTLQEQANATIADMLAQIFDGNSPPYCVSWTQYTPYFNDGDECTFGVNDFDVYLTEDDFDEDDYDSYSNGVYPLLDELSAFTQTELGEQTFKVAFGDHSKVIVRKDGIEILEYNHD